MPKWENLVPPDLLQAAYRTGNELAWPAAQALLVLAILEDHGQRILGVDVWIATEDGPTPVIYDWNESWAVRDDLPSTPREFITTFAWAKAGLANEERLPHFNFTVA